MPTLDSWRIVQQSINSEPFKEQEWAWIFGKNRCKNCFLHCKTSYFDNYYYHYYHFVFFRILAMYSQLMSHTLRFTMRVGMIYWIQNMKPQNWKIYRKYITENKRWHLPLCKDVRVYFIGWCFVFGIHEHCHWNTHWLSCRGKWTEHSRLNWTPVLS